MLLGISDIGIIGAVTLSAVSMAICVGYGLKNWNKDN